MKKEIEKYFDKLWPITRSLTGNGNRKSFSILAELIDLKIIEIPDQVFYASLAWDGKYSYHELIDCIGVG